MRNAELAPTRVGALAMLTALALVRLTCESAPVVTDPAPAIAEGAKRYTVAWVRPEGTGGALVVQQFDKKSLVPISAPRTVERRADLVPGPIDLAAVGSGYIAVAHIKHSWHRDPRSFDVIVVALDADGAKHGVEDGAGMDRSCAAGTFGETVLVPYIYRRKDDGDSYDRFELAAFDANGYRHTVWRIAGSASPTGAGCWLMVRTVSAGTS